MHSSMVLMLHYGLLPFLCYLLFIYHCYYYYCFFAIFFHRLDHQSDDEDVLSFPGKRRLISFLSWLDYVDQLSKEAHKVNTFPVTQWHVTLIP